MAIDPVTGAILVQTGLTIGGGILDYITSADERKLKEKVLNEMVADQERISRWSKGQFSPRERTQMMQAAEPGVNQVAANVAQRGLGTSPAGAQVIAEAQQRPILEAQAAAMQAKPGVDANLFSVVNQLAAEDQGFQDSLATISQNYFTLQGMGKQDPMLEQIGTALQQLEQIAGILEGAPGTTGGGEL